MSWDVQCASRLPPEHNRKILRFYPALEVGRISPDIPDFETPATYPRKSGSQTPMNQTGGDFRLFNFLPRLASTRCLVCGRL